jgi:hypothetical protein
MNLTKFVSAAAVLAFLTTTGASAQNLEAIEKAEQAVIAAWNATPLTYRKALFVTQVQGFGVYQAREGAVFKGGEPLIVYAEPVGYAWKDNGDGTFSFGFDVDLLVKSSTGEIVGGQENFQKLELKSRSLNREFMLTLTLNIDGAPAGDYVVEYRTRDINSPKAAVISLPFTVAN